MPARKLCAGLVATLAVMAANAAQAITLDFEEFGHGEVLSGTTVSGVTILAHNPRKPHDYGAVFDTRVTGSPDPDLEAISFLGGTTAWSNGNLSQESLGFDPELNNILIVQRDGTDCDTGTCSVPNDQGGGGSSLDFIFDRDLRSFGFDLIDVDSGEEGGTVILYDGAMSVSFTFGELLPVSLFGNHSANRFDPLLATDVGFSAFDRVTIVFGGSGGVDNIRFEPIPEPSTVALLGLGLLGFAGRSRFRRP